jgi:hypothetical protein
VIGTWALALLHQAKEIEQGFCGEFCAPQGRAAQAKVSGRQGDAQTQVLAVGHQDMTRRPGAMADGEDSEAPSKQRVGRVGHFDLFGLFGLGIKWVLEGGIMLGSRSTRFPTDDSWSV